MKGQGIVALGAIGLVLMAISRGRGPRPGARGATVTWLDAGGTKGGPKGFLHQGIAQQFAETMRNAGATDVRVRPA